jgi:hypothetical protein
MELDPEVTKRTLGHPHATLSPRRRSSRPRRSCWPSAARRPTRTTATTWRTRSSTAPRTCSPSASRRDHGGIRRRLFKESPRPGRSTRCPAAPSPRRSSRCSSAAGWPRPWRRSTRPRCSTSSRASPAWARAASRRSTPIPDEARSVQPSHMGFMDPVRTPESFRVGVDLHMARASRKGRDGRIYTQLRDKKGGKLTWKSPQDLVDSAVTTPDVCHSQWPTKRVPVMKGGKLDYVGKARSTTSCRTSSRPGSARWPTWCRSRAPPSRAGWRWAPATMTQALPLVNAEAPHVQGGSPAPGRAVVRGGVRQAHGGRPGGQGRPGRAGRRRGDHGPVRRRHPGRGRAVPEPPVQPEDVHPPDADRRAGETFKPGQLLARSNYTDDTGATALGLNLRTAYFPYKGLQLRGRQRHLRVRRRPDDVRAHVPARPGGHPDGTRSARRRSWPCSRPRTTARRWTGWTTRGSSGSARQVEYGQPLVLAAKERDRAAEQDPQEAPAGVRR